MNKAYRIYNIFRRFCAFVLGSVFLFSGILKLMDPVGSGLVMKSYFDFLHIGFMDFSAKFFGVAFALAESVLGAALMSGVWRKAVGIAVICLTTFFTALTLALVVFNPAMDCGCFGEAFHLTHSQTLVKNLILCGLCCGAFIPLKNLEKPVKVKYASFAISSALLVALMIYSLVALPLKDYTAFKAGAVLQTAAGPFGESSGEPEFIYEKDGVRQSFTLENLPDSSWTFVDSRINPEAFSAGAVLSLTDVSGEYCDSLVSEGNVVIVSAYDPLSSRRLDGIREFVSGLRGRGLRTVVLVPGLDVLPFREDASLAGTVTGGDGVRGGDGSVSDSSVSGSSGIASVADGFLPGWLDGALFFADRKTIATLNRSNGGVTYVSDGQIVRKWSYALRPSEEKLNQILSEDPTSLALETQSRGSLAVQGFFLGIFAVLLLL